MRLGGIGLAVALATMLAFGLEAAAEIYMWTDAQGVVHMTDQWAGVPEAMRPHVSVRDSSAAPVPPAPQASLPDSAAPQPQTSPQPLRPVVPETTAPPTSDSPSSPPTSPEGRNSSWFIPRQRPLIHAPKRMTPPFPYDVQLDPHDDNFVWVGPNRVPKELFTYPRVSLEQQSQFQQRLRTLEQRQPPRFQQPTRPVPRR
jgi:hypothetical protein